MQIEMSTETQNELAKELRACTEAMLALIEAMRPNFERIQAAVLELMRAWVEAMRPTYERLIKQIHAYVILIRREQLYLSLPRWIPDRLARFVADRCPERWLPEWRIEDESD